MANTTNLDLVKPAGTDHALISVLNSNSDKIDAFAGQTKDDIETLEEGLAYIVGNTNTTGETLAVGQFVYVKGHSTIPNGLRKVTASISNNASITTSNTSPDTAGGLNTLNSKISDFEFGQTATDADNLTTGMIYLGSASGHIPTSHAYYILTFDNTGDNGAQMAIRRNASGYIYFRSKSRGTWGSWYQVTANVVS